ncbi:MAG: four helix bundle protein [Polaribacter sp.]
MEKERKEFIEKVKKRTKQLAIDVMLFYNEMHKTEASRIIGKQMIRSVTSTASNYRAACVARSQRDFYAKLSIVVEEADETLFWLEMLRNARFTESKKVSPLIEENLELLKIVSKARKNSKSY